MTMKKTKTSISENKTQTISKSITDEGCIRLATAIVVDVFEDYQKTVKGYQKAKEDQNKDMIKIYEAHLNSLRNFIQSEYCAGLVFLATNTEYDLTGEELLNLVEKKGRVL